VVRGALAHAGVLVFGVALIVPSIAWSHAPSTSDVVVAAAFARVTANDVLVAPQLNPIAEDAPLQPKAVAVAASAVAGQEAAASARAQPAARPAPPPPLDPPATSGIVLASWYGPGFYGNRTACGLTYTPELLGVAHRTLPCGTLVTLAFRGKSVTVPVIDRGPFIAGRSLDLSNATRLVLACTDLCTLSMRLGP